MWKCMCSAFTAMSNVPKYMQISATIGTGNSKYIGKIWRGPPLVACSYNCTRVYSIWKEEFITLLVNTVQSAQPAAGELQTFAALHSWQHRRGKSSVAAPHTYILRPASFISTHSDTLANISWTLTTFCHFSKFTQLYLTTEHELNDQFLAEIEKLHENFPLLVVHFKSNISCTIFTICQ